MIRQPFNDISPDEADADLSQALGLAQAMFVELIVERIMAFEAYRKLASLSDQPQLEMAKIADIAHKISGVGATLGFGKAGALAAELDRAISDNPARLANPDYLKQVVDPRLEALLDELESLLDA
ncbi:hypothetical protein GCM10010873_09900 [Cypionkella aquatica]|uniref:HPt domain-containing protein n=1 Tax=Cypionkella aquatica TaxID=1756042 RepID=A0AA37X2B2_9RHOB|nr:Hpt domain-containing protein [Cypionkella aquatica]GLS86016.1 hypothetical protein GCM10010873_09900 [Cypionkella aquatica]